MRKLTVADGSPGSAGRILRSIALVLSLAGASLDAQAQIREVAAKKAATSASAKSGRTKSAKGILAKDRTRDSEPASKPQAASSGQSQSNQSYPSQSAVLFSPDLAALPYQGLPSSALPYGAAGMPYGASPYYPPGVYPAAYHDPSPMGGEPVMPGPMMPSGEPMPGYDYEMGMDSSWCPYCEGAGCQLCGGDQHGHGQGLLKGFLSNLGPYSEGGRCAPRWFDVSVEALYWTRDEVSDFVPFTAFTRFGPIIMSSDSMDFEEQPGMRFNSLLQILPGTSVEFSYFGLFSWSADASIRSPIGDELFSPYSNFGALIGAGQPFDESDQAQFHSLRASSSLDSFELSVRKYWTGPNCRLQGSIKSGVRYLYLIDDLNFFTLGRNIVIDPLLGTTGPAGASTSDVRTHNSLTGFQAGAEVWATIVPGVLVGSDLKAGVYGNHAKQNTRVFGSTTSGGTSADLFETARHNDVAVVGEVNVAMLVRLKPNLTLKGGYSLLFIDRVALAAENFNTENPFNNTRTVPALDDTGDAFYHGGFAGLELIW